MNKRVEDAPKTCSNCGSAELLWHVGTKNLSCVVDGWLRASDLSIEFLLGCEECSETLMTVYDEDFMRQVNKDVEVTYEDVTEAIKVFGMTMIPGLVVCIAKAAVRVGCFKSLEGAGRYFMTALEQEQELRATGEGKSDGK